MYRNADEIEKLKKIKEDSDRESVTVLQQLKDLSAGTCRAEECEGCCPRNCRDYGYPKGNEGEPLSLAGQLRNVPEAFERYVSTTTRQYVSHVLGLVKSYRPTTPLDALGKGSKSDCTDDQFSQYLRETSMVVDQIVESLSKPESPSTLNVIFVSRVAISTF